MAYCNAQARWMNLKVAVVGIICFGPSSSPLVGGRQGPGKFGGSQNWNLFNQFGTWYGDRWWSLGAILFCWWWSGAAGRWCCCSYVFALVSIIFWISTLTASAAASVAVGIFFSAAACSKTKDLTDLSGHSRNSGTVTDEVGGNNAVWRGGIREFLKLNHRRLNSFGCYEEVNILPFLSCRITWMKRRKKSTPGLPQTSAYCSTKLTNATERKHTLGIS